jgi:hypothetical protein
MIKSTIAKYDTNQDVRDRCSLPASSAALNPYHTHT